MGREELLAVNVVPVQRTTTWLGRLKEKEVSHPVSVTPGEGSEAEQSAADTADEVRVHPVTQNPLKDFLGEKIYVDTFATIIQLYWSIFIESEP